MTTDSAIIDALEAALKTIRLAGGFRTDAGTSVFRNLEYEGAPDADLYPCIIVFPGEVTSGYEGDVPPALGEQNNFLSVRIEGHVVDDERGSQAHGLKADLRKALTAAGDFGGLAEEIQGFKCAAEVSGGADGYRGYVAAEFVVFYVTARGDM